MLAPFKCVCVSLLSRRLGSQRDPWRSLYTTRLVRLFLDLLYTVCLIRWCVCVFVHAFIDIKLYTHNRACITLYLLHTMPLYEVMAPLCVRMCTCGFYINVFWGGLRAYGWYQALHHPLWGIDDISGDVIVSTPWWYSFVALSYEVNLDMFLDLSRYMWSLCFKLCRD